MLVSEEALDLDPEAYEPGLSTLQCCLMELLWIKTRAFRRDRKTRETTEAWGVPWCPSKDLHPSKHRGWSSSDRTDTARALRRLEARGLVERLHPQDDQSWRTTYVKLTPRGNIVAKQLTSDD